MKRKWPREVRRPFVGTARNQLELDVAAYRNHRIPDAHEDANLAKLKTSAALKQRVYVQVRIVGPSQQLGHESSLAQHADDVRKVEIPLEGDRCRPTNVVVAVEKRVQAERNADVIVDRVNRAIVHEWDGDAHTRSDGSVIAAVVPPPSPFDRKLRLQLEFIGVVCTRLFDEIFRVSRGWRSKRCHEADREAPYERAEHVPNS